MSQEKEYEMDLKERIITEASKLLSRLGPSTMTMDMIARNCGISKRTLYEHFPDKRTLIEKSIHMIHQQQAQHYKEFFERSKDCFEALFNVYLSVRTFLQSKTIDYADEIKRLYPDLHEQTYHQEKAFIEGLSEVLSKAQDEGLVIKRINTRIASYIFISEMNHVNQSEIISELGFSRVEVFDGAFVNFLRGIATVKGISMIDEFLSKQTQNFQYNG